MNDKITEKQFLNVFLIMKSYPDLNKTKKDMLKCDQEVYESKLADAKEKGLITKSALEEAQEYKYDAFLEKEIMEKGFEDDEFYITENEHHKVVELYDAAIKELQEAE